MHATARIGDREVYYDEKSKYWRDKETGKRVKSPHAEKKDEELPLTKEKSPKVVKGLDGKTVLHVQPPKAVLDAAGYYFQRKEAYDNCKSQLECATNDLIAAMRKHKVTMCKVDNTFGDTKVLKLEEVEKLKIQKDDI